MNDSLREELTDSKIWICGWKMCEIRSGGGCGAVGGSGSGSGSVGGGVGGGRVV